MVLEGLKLGDSIAVNGVCLTIVVLPSFFEARLWQRHFTKPI